jgi:hypothetical protein
MNETDLDHYYVVIERPVIAATVEEFRE